MKVFEIQHQFGLDSLTLTNKPEPIPNYGQVLIKLRATSLNYRDLMVVKGLYNPNLPLPLIPFSDAVGEVLAVGEGVTRVKVGVSEAPPKEARLAGIFFQKWLSGEFTDAQAKSDLGGNLPGLLAEYAVLHQDGVVHVPQHLTDEEAATLPCAAVTAWQALVTQGTVKAGDTVLIQGTGGVSLFALQFAQLLGARVIVTSSSDEKLERVLVMGASNGINYKRTPNWDKVVRELTDGVGVDHIVEVGGAGTLEKSMRAVRRGGCISLIGVLAGGTQVNPLPIVMKNIRVQGIYVGSREMFKTMNRAISLHKLRPVVDRVFTFEEAPQALEYMQSGLHFGKICLRV